MVEGRGVRRRERPSDEFTNFASLQPDGRVMSVEVDEDKWHEERR